MGVEEYAQQKLLRTLQVETLSPAWLCVQTCGDAGDILGGFWMGGEEYAR